MSHSNAYAMFPAVRTIVADGRADGHELYQVLADLEAHARRHQSSLTFHDAVDIARVWHGFEQDAIRAAVDRNLRFHDVG